MELSIEQKLAFDKYIQGENIFITGPGGCGKSELIRHIYKHALEHEKNIQVTALTGCAAILLNCNAKTIHSCAGIGIGNKSNEYLLKKVKSNKIAKKMWKKTDILVIDEVSMLSLKLFDTLNTIGKQLRSNNKPFGGIQLLFSGDFFQLPPIGDKDNTDTQRFCFESSDWFQIFPIVNHITLHKIFRQTDNTYANILNQIRNGQIKQKTCSILQNCVGKQIPNDRVSEPTKLFPVRTKVEYVNNTKLRLLDGIEHKFTIKQVTDLEINEKNEKIKREFTKEDIVYELEYLTNNLMCDKEIVLKVGSQVMCVINIQDDLENGAVRLCNGSQGIVTGFCNITGYPIVKFNNGHEEVMRRHVWSSDKIPGIGISQIPLILAWALTIHKSQGATLDMAEIDVGNNIFECGQTYVALSRVKSLDGLYLTSFDVNKIRINKKVKDFYDTIKVKPEEGNVKVLCSNNSFDNLLQLN
jgi:ATP-dependent DNA helicase PIF1